METILKTQNLTKRFGSKTAVNAVNMTVNRGEIYGFIGKNGAGKTTVMRMVVGTMPCTEGTVELFGGEPLGSARCKIGSLIESPGIYKGCTAKENMRRIAILSGGDDKKIEELLNLVGLGDTGTKKAGVFSLGMKQRLGIAIALMGDPEFLVLDEPVNGLDPEGIKEVRDLVLKLNRERGMTFLISSHLLDELGKIATKFGIIDNGVLLEEVGASELAERASDGLQIIVDDPVKAVEVLAPFAPAEKINVTGYIVMLREGYNDPAAVNRALVEAGVAVKQLTMHSGGLEEYFIRRIGR